MECLFKLTVETAYCNFNAAKNFRPLKTVRILPETYDKLSGYIVSL